MRTFNIILITVFSLYIMIGLNKFLLDDKYMGTGLIVISIINIIFVLDRYGDTDFKDRY